MKREGTGINPRIFGEQHERIFGKKKRRAGRGTFVMRNGELVQVAGDDLAVRRKRDSKKIVSMATGCHPEQAAEFNREFGHLGVKFDARTGDAVYEDRAAKLRVLKARGFYDRDEVRG